MSNFGLNWTPERVEKLKVLWADGFSARDIAARLGVTNRNAVIGKVHRLGLSGRAKSSSSAAPHARKARSQNAPVYRPSRLLAAAGGVFTFSRGAAAPAQLEVEEPSEIVIQFEQRKTLLQLTARTCRWPIGDPGSGDFFFCGGDVCGDGPYCAYHHRIAYQPLNNRRADKFRRFMERAS